MTIAILVGMWAAFTAALFFTRDDAPDPEFVRMLSTAPRFHPARPPQERVRLARRYAVASELAGHAVTSAVTIALIAVVGWALT
jgi:hypothetical protein